MKIFFLLVAAAIATPLLAQSATSALLRHARDRLFDDDPAGRGCLERVHGDGGCVVAEA